MSESKKYTITETFFFISTVVTLILGVKQLYEDFKPEVIVEGVVSSYQSPPFLLNSYRKSQIYSSVLESIAEEGKVFSQKDIDSLIREVDYKNRTVSFEDTTGLIITRGNDYRSYWVFSIKNTGDKPLEEMILQTNSNGFSKVEFPDKKSAYHAYTRKIKLGKLNPAQEIIVKLWGDIGYNEGFSDYKEIKLMHKNGWADVDFPKEKSSFMRQLSGIPSYVYFAFSIVLGLFLFYLRKSSKNNS